MQIDLNFLVIIDVLSVATAFMLGLLFFSSKSDNKKANLFLGLFLWSLSAEVLNSLINGYSEEQFYIPQASLFTIPFLLFYVKTTINSTIKPILYLLFLPGILVNLFVPFEELRPIEYALNIGILIYVLILLKKHRVKVNNYYSDIEFNTLKWIKLIVFIYLGFHVLWIIEDIIAFQDENIVEYFAALSSILTLFMIYWIGHNGFSQPEIFKQKLFNTKTKLTGLKEEEYLKEHDIEHYNTIKSKIEAEKLFKDQKLNLSLLADRLQIKEKELSRLINQHANTNFYQFINQFRVNEFKNLLNSPKAKQLSILGLAEEAGFSSKSTFYTAFKSLEGLTPKQYQSSLKKSE